jgi:hypothetical protein
VSLNSTLDGRAVETLKIADGRSHVAQNGAHYADGSLLPPNILDSSTLRAIQHVATALQANASKCSGFGTSLLPPREPGGDGRPQPIALLLPPQAETPGTALPCIICTGTCSSGLAACSLGAIGAGLGCGVWGWLCVAVTLAACAIVFQACELMCYVPGGGCCPVNCGWPGGCCLQGHTCRDPQTHRCCAVICGTGCCNEGDTCFTNRLGVSDCCPRGQQTCPGPRGAQCCERNQACNGITGDCCSEGTEVCGSAGCCPAGTCNNNPTAPACCPGGFGQPGGPCGAGTSRGCCPPGQTCNPMTNTCCTGQPCGAIGCCPAGTCNNNLSAPACCPGAFGQPGGPCDGPGATAQHCCPPMQVCVQTAEFVEQCCPAPGPGLVISYHACSDNRCCTHSCDARGLCGKN